MLIGALDNVDPAIAYIQYIPLDMILIKVTDDGNDATANSAVDGGGNPDVLSSAPSWSWVLASFGFIGIVVAFLLLYRKRKSLNDSTEFGSVAKTPKGSFPVPIEILDDNSEFDHDEIYKDDDEEEEKECEDVIVAKPPSWRRVPEPRNQPNDEFSRLQINATDPNQPVVKPVLDEEAETYISNV